VASRWFTVLAASFFCSPGTASSQGQNHMLKSWTVGLFVCIASVGCHVPEFSENVVYGCAAEMFSRIL